MPKKDNANKIPCCLQVTKLPMNTVKAQLLSEERFAGVVSTELGSGQWRSEVDDSLEVSLPLLLSFKSPQVMKRAPYPGHTIFIISKEQHINIATCLEITGRTYCHCH